MSNHRFSGDPNQYLGGHAHPHSQSHGQPHLSPYESHHQSQQHAIHPHYAQLSSASAVNGHSHHNQPPSHASSGSVHTHPSHTMQQGQSQSSINVNSNVGSPSSINIAMMDNVNLNAGVNSINSMHRRNQFTSAPVPPHPHSLSHSHANSYTTHNHAHPSHAHAHAHINTNSHTHPSHATHAMASPHTHNHISNHTHPTAYSYHTHSTHPMNGHSHPHGLIHASSSSLSTMSPSISNTRPSPTSSSRNTGRNILVHDHDVLSGRGVNIAQHPGNQRFRTLITTFRDQEYCTSYSAGEKRAVALQIIKHIKELEPPGRFLKRDGRGQGSRGLSGPWDELSEREAIKKTCQALRDCNRQDRQGYAKGVAAPGDVIKIVEEASHIPAKERAQAAAHLIAAEATTNAMNAISVAARGGNGNIPNSILEAASMVHDMDTVNPSVYSQRREDMDNSSSVSISSRTKRSREEGNSVPDTALDMDDNGDMNGAGNMDGSISGNVSANGVNGADVGNGNGSTCAGSTNTNNMANTNANIVSNNNSSNSNSNYPSPTSYYSAHSQQQQSQQPLQPYHATSDPNSMSRFTASAPNNTILPNTGNYGLHYQHNTHPYTSLQQQSAATSTSSTHPHHQAQYQMNVPYPGALNTNTAFTSAGVPSYYSSSNPPNSNTEFILPMAAAQAPAPFQDAILSSIHHNTYFNSDPYTNIINSALLNPDHQVIKKQRTEDTEPSTGPSEPSPNNLLASNRNSMNANENKSSSTAPAIGGGGGGNASYLDQDGERKLREMIANGSNRQDSSSNNEMIVSNDCDNENNERMEQQQQQNDVDSSSLYGGVGVKIDEGDEGSASGNEVGSWVHGHSNHTSSIVNDERFHDALGGF